METTTVKKSRRKSVLLKASVILTIISAVLISGCGENPSNVETTAETAEETSAETTTDTTVQTDAETDAETAIESFEGVKLSRLTKLTLNEYIDFTVPYTWTFGKVDAEEEAVEEAIAVTGDNAVMSIFLKKVHVSDEKTFLSEEVSKLNSTYSDYGFKKSELFESEVALIEGTPKQGDVKMYVAVIPEGEKSVWVTYAYKAGDSAAELYFSSAISEMLKK